MDDVKNPFTGRWVTVYRVDLYEGISVCIPRDIFQRQRPEVNSL